MVSSVHYLIMRQVTKNVSRETLLTFVSSTSQFSDGSVGKGTEKLYSRIPTFVVLDATISPASIALEEESEADPGSVSA